MRCKMQTVCVSMSWGDGDKEGGRAGRGGAQNVREQWKWNLIVFMLQCFLQPEICLLPYTELLFCLIDNMLDGKRWYFPGRQRERKSVALSHLICGWFFPRLQCTCQSKRHLIVISYSEDNFGCVCAVIRTAYPLLSSHYISHCFVINTTSNIDYAYF